MTDKYMENVRASHCAGRREKIDEARQRARDLVIQAQGYGQADQLPDTVGELIELYESGNVAPAFGDAPQPEEIAASLRALREELVAELKLYRFDAYTGGDVTEEEL